MLICEQRFLIISGDTVARNFGLPYRPTNPRTVRGAKKRGWHIVQVDLKKLSDVSWVGLCIWCERALGGYWVNSFHYRQFAFESGADATAFKLKWG